MPSQVSISWRREQLTLLSDAAMWWPAQRALVIADPHLGKAASFRALGVPAPEAVTGADLQRLSRALDLVGASRLIVLGDLLHAPSSLATPVLDAVGAWREAHAELQVTLVRGNHDRRAGDPPRDWRFECVDGPHRVGSLDLVHEPESAGRRPALAGHMHPGVVARASLGPGTLRAPCFWFGANVAVLPAFGGFTGRHAIRPALGDRVFALGEGSIAELSARAPAGA